ncbi:MAG: WD40 repeat domain-containing protein [Deltaproteobacteria bacterium]|nr:MAG: WD40 repeat domain-containing protein [Deltaproteobacteria bacterium]
MGVHSQEGVAVRSATWSAIAMLLVGLAACSLYDDDADPLARSEGGVPPSAHGSPTNGTGATPGGAADATGEPETYDDTDPAPAGPCPCPRGDCTASDDMPCDSGEGLCGEGMCHPTGTLESLPVPHEGFWPTAVSLSADGSLLAITAERAEDGPDGDRQASVVPLDGGDPRVEPDAIAAVFHPVDAAVWAVALGEAVEVRDLGGGVLHRVEGAGPPMAFSPDGARLAATVAAGVRVVSLDAAADEVLLDHPQDRDARLWLLAFSPEGTRVATGRGASGFGSPVGDVRVFDAHSGERLHLFDCPAASGGFNADASLLAVACWNYTALYDLSSGTATVLPAPMLAQGARFLTPHDGEPRLLLGSFLGLVRVLRHRDGEWVIESAVEFPAVRDVVELPDGALLLAPWSDLTVHRWTPSSRL